MADAKDVLAMFEDMEQVTPPPKKGGGGGLVKRGPDYYRGEIAKGKDFMAKMRSVAKPSDKGKRVCFEADGWRKVLSQIAPVKEADNIPVAVAGQLKSMAARAGLIPTKRGAVEVRGTAVCIYPEDFTDAPGKSDIERFIAAKAVKQGAEKFPDIKNLRELFPGEVSPQFERSLEAYLAKRPKRAKKGE